MQLIGVFLSDIQITWHDNHTVGTRRDDIFEDFLKLLFVESLIIAHLHIYVKVSSDIAGLHCSFLYFFPISLALMLWYQNMKCVRLVICQSTGIHIGTIVNLF